MMTVTRLRDVRKMPRIAEERHSTKKAVDEAERQADVLRVCSDVGRPGLLGLNIRLLRAVEISEGLCLQLEDRIMSLISGALDTQQRLHFLLIAMVWLIQPAAVMADDAVRYEIEGRQLSAGEAEVLEARLAERPDDLAARVKLASYYMFQRSEAGNEARARHALWLIRHHPASAGIPACQLNAMLDGEAYDLGRDLWLEQVESHGSEPRVLGNAARYLLLSDRELAAELFTRAKELEPANPEWPRQLGHLHKLELQRQGDGAAQATAASALRELEEALTRSDSISRWAGLPDAARAAFAAGELDKAESYANELLAGAAGQEESWNYGNAIHHGNLILGRIALAAGNEVLASDHLLAAGRTSGSPQLDSFGPNMTLAKELLEAGEREVVLEYFELCAKFWKMHRGRLESWGSAVAEGGVPQFGANLFY